MISITMGSASASAIADPHGGAKHRATTLNNIQERHAARETRCLFSDTKLWFFIEIDI